MQQDNVTSWFTNDENDKTYHLGQFKKIYRSTEIFTSYVSDKIKNSNVVLDMACGYGANTAYLGEKFPDCQFIGKDVNKMCVTMLAIILYIMN